VQKQVELPIRYKGLTLEGCYRIDLLVDGELVIELKSVDKLLDIHAAQLLTYMKLAGTTTGLLVNFNQQYLRDGIKRFVL